ncbi:Fc.00g016550.m01.CDS01 [Cosmosporella sp. VM-42]
MAASKMSILTSALVLMGAFAPGAIATDAPLSACSSTEAPVSSQIGTATSDGQVLYSWSVCSVIHATNCEVSTSTSAPAPESIPVVAPSGPVASSAATQGQTTGAGGASSAPPGGQPGNPSQTASGSIPPGPGYSVPPAVTGTGVTNPTESATGTAPAGESTPILTPTTDSAGHPTTITNTPVHSGHSGSGSASGSGANPSASGTEGGSPSGTTGAPGTSATGAGAMLNAFPGVILGAAGMAAVYFL